ncbi:hypothetical protein FHETE_10508 [Fusarium heterosporum]|uniref:Uncharacterized protein n=1 Tax=Fusarium heterosporum TaxID=42747 RepID=A0A8H5SUH4_FUSHE|nr:hypothetical protein FHETE_10508 [Fusarium heterosporum]
MVRAQPSRPPPLVQPRSAAGHWKDFSASGRAQDRSGTIFPACACWEVTVGANHPSKYTTIEPSPKRSILLAHEGSALYGTPLHIRESCGFRAELLAPKSKSLLWPPAVVVLGACLADVESGEMFAGPSGSSMLTCKTNGTVLQMLEPGCLQQAGVIGVHNARFAGIDKNSSALCKANGAQNCLPLSKNKAWKWNEKLTRRWVRSLSLRVLVAGMPFRAASVTDPKAGSEAIRDSEKQNETAFRLLSENERFKISRK